MFPGSILISLTSAATSSGPEVGAGAAEAAESEGDAPPFVLGTKTAAAMLRALSAPLRGLDGTVAAALALADAAEGPGENWAAGELGVCALAEELEAAEVEETDAEAWSKGQPSF